MRTQNRDIGSAGFPRKDFMAKGKQSSFKSVANLSVNFIESAFLILVENSLPVYRHNVDRKRPPVAAGENVSAAAAGDRS
jgi:hypothetical protein